jgi:hypothetical protein
MTARERLYAALDENTCFCSGCEDGAGPPLDVYDAAVTAAAYRAAADLIADLTDPDPCWYDHHGYCQAHGWFATDPACPHARAKAFAARADEMEQQ